MYKTHRGLALAGLLLSAVAVPAHAGGKEILECVPDTTMPAAHNLFAFDYDSNTVHYYLADDDGAEVKMPMDLSWTAKIKVKADVITWTLNDNGQHMSSRLDRSANTMVTKMHMAMGGDTVDMTEHAKCKPWEAKK